MSGMMWSSRVVILVKALPQPSKTYAKILYGDRLIPIGPT